MELHKVLSDLRAVLSEDAIDIPAEVQLRMEQYFTARFKAFLPGYEAQRLPYTLAYSMAKGSAASNMSMVIFGDSGHQKAVEEWDKKNPAKLIDLLVAKFGENFADGVMAAFESNKARAVAAKEKKAEAEKLRHIEGIYGADNDASALLHALIGQYGGSYNGSAGSVGTDRYRIPGYEATAVLTSVPPDIDAAIKLAAGDNKSGFTKVGKVWVANDKPTGKSGKITVKLTKTPPGISLRYVRASSRY